MRFASFELDGVPGLAISDNNNTLRGCTCDASQYPGSLEELIDLGLDKWLEAGEQLSNLDEIDTDKIHWLPPVSYPSKIICIGLNYVDHSTESGFIPPDYPTVFSRYSSSLIGHTQALIKPKASNRFDYEGELVAVIGKGGRHIQADCALDHVIGYSVFNDASARDFQKKSPQWTMGKNFDATGAFGPFLVSADELPPGCQGLKLQTRLNGQAMQEANIDDMIFNVASLVTTISEVMTLQAGDVIVTGTPAGVGFARRPPVYMQEGDYCEVEIEGVGLLSNTVKNET